MKMKTIKHILFPGVFAALLALGSCVAESHLLLEENIVHVEIEDNSLPATRSDGETAESIRIIVFNDLASTPAAESNRVYTPEEVEIIPASGSKPAKVRLSMKVLRRENEPNERVIVAIINEPADMTEDLDEISTFDDLAALTFDMTNFIADNHLGLRSGETMPMTGAIWTDKLFEKPSTAGLESNILKLEVHRAVARVDVYLKKGEDVDTNLLMSAGSTVRLDNTYDKSNFFMHTAGDFTIGSVQTVDSDDLIDGKSWTLTSGTQAISDETPVCVFYTAERSCATTDDRLELTISVKTNEGATRSGTLKIVSAFDVEQMKKPEDERGSPKPVDVIRRNNIYKVVATIGVNGIESEVRSWEERDIDTEF